MDADALPVRINSCGFFETDRFWRLGPERTRAWTDLNLWLLVDGAGTVALPAGEVALEPGTCLILRGGEACDFRPTARRLRHYFVHFDYLDRGRPRPPTHPDLPPRHRRIPGHRLLAELLDRAIADHRRPGGDPARAPRWLAAALMEVARHDRGDAGGDPRFAAVDRLCERIVEDPAAAWRIAACAAELGLGVDRFARLFRARAGCAPRVFITRARLDLAASLLCGSAAAVADIARQAGYADPHFFSRHFARRFGRSPAAYRREARG